MRPVSKLVALVLGVVLTPIAAAHAAPDDVKLNFAAATPSTYSHATGGGQWADGSTAYKVESLEGGDFACGDLVTFFTEGRRGRGRRPAPRRSISTTRSSPTRPDKPGVALGDILHVQVNAGDPANVGDNGSTATLVSGPTLVGTKYTPGRARRRHRSSHGSRSRRDGDRAGRLTHRLPDRRDSHRQPAGEHHRSSRGSDRHDPGREPDGAVQEREQPPVGRDPGLEVQRPERQRRSSTMASRSSRAGRCSSTPITRGTNTAGDASGVTDDNGFVTFTHVTPATYAGVRGARQRVGAAARRLVEHRPRNRAAVRCRCRRGRGPDDDRRLREPVHQGRHRDDDAGPRRAP